MDHWTSTLNNITKQTFTEFGLLTSDQLNWKPNPNTWSIAQNLDHLIMVNESYFTVLASLKAGTYNTPFIAKIGFMVSLLGKTVLNAVQPNRNKKMKTFPIWEPITNNVIGNILNRFQNHQNELIQIMEDAKGLIEKALLFLRQQTRILCTN